MADKNLAYDRHFFCMPPEQQNAMLWPLGVKNGKIQDTETTLFKSEPETLRNKNNSMRRRDLEIQAQDFYSTLSLIIEIISC